jgi:hypothetical protein
LEAFANQIVLFSPENRPPEWFEGQVKRMQEIASLGNEIEHKANEPEKEQAQIKTFRFPSNLRRIGKSARQKGARLSVLQNMKELHRR